MWSGTRPIASDAPSALKFGRAIFGNMIALGRLFRLVDVHMNPIELEKLLPKSYVKENLRAIQTGYDLNLYED